MELLNVELEQEVELQTSYELSGGIIPTGTINITTNGTHDVSSYAEANVNVEGGITPTGTKQVTIDSSGTTTEDVSAYANVEITVPQGQYKPNIDATPTNPSISVSNGGLITAEVPTQYINDLLKSTFTEGYVESSDVSMKVKIGGSATKQMNTVSGQTVTPTTSTQYIAVQGDYVLGAINVAPIPSQYIIPTGTKQITENGTGIDVSEYEFVDVNVSGGGATTDEMAFGGMTGDLVINGGGTIKDSAFRKQNITSIRGDLVTVMGAYAFYDCAYLTSVSFPILYDLYATQAFANCTSLQSICFPKLGTGARTGLYSGCFSGCTALELADLNICSAIGATTFNGDTNFKTLILRRTTMATLANINAFTGTPFASGGSGGTIYVPNALINTYKTATNWSTLYGYGTVTFSAIENSIYATQYADGTPVS